MKRTMRPASVLAAIGAAVLLTPFDARSQDLKLPPDLTFMAYDTGTAGFNVTVAIGKMLKEKYNTNLRVLPAGNDVARLAPVRAGRAQMSGMGAGVYLAQEGVFDFAAKEWGPQPVRLTLTSLDCNAGSLGVARDTGVKEFKDLKGKRVGFVVGAPALNQNALSALAFAGLKKEDVKVVEFASYGAMWKGMVNNDVDAAWATTISAPTKEVETSPRGILWPLLHHADKAGWERLQAIAPWNSPHVATCGSGGISPANPHELANHPYPAYTVYNTLDADLVYAITKAMVVGYDAYKDGAPSVGGLAADRQLKHWSVPYHLSAVKVLKEAGQWHDADEAHNNGLIKRQEVLAAAWADYLKLKPEADETKFRAGWMSARRAALKNASMAIGVDETPSQ